MIRTNPPIAQAASAAVRSMADESGHHEGDGLPRSGGRGMNVGEAERSASVVAGVTLGLLALTRPVGLRGLILAGAGAAMVYRGVSGRCGLYDALGINTRDAAQAGRTRTDFPDERGTSP